MGDGTLTGGCFCGRVRYELPVDAVRFGFASCHCSVCRRTHGAPFVMWLGMGREDAGRFVLADPSAVRGFATSASAEKFFCATCGTHTHLEYRADAGRWAGERHVATATLDERCVAALEVRMAATGKPRYLHIFASDRAACLGDLEEWAAAPRFGGASGMDKLD